VDIAVGMAVGVGVDVEVGVIAMEWSIELETSGR
jgi:hypothetical protein